MRLQQPIMVLLLALATTGGAVQAAPAPPSAKPSPSPSAEAAVYVCPMHPEVTAKEPGRCPKCGMHLEKKAEASKSQDPKQTKGSR